ncbi:bacillithiol biosynthesis cysteine-adding enzyme BshC [Paenibacillus massiliensis]|uniref:bacillithiol biosynthesis cysteine-adding enzyme BshC n=1 Tax=Paenibacillus massiliensis TaxID=225917 RepID=UPI000364C4FC|nr:bacillithiol biosynthesis cysteine-adding enzyme BshC [Paenibacillus massiliensis]
MNIVPEALRAGSILAEDYARGTVKAMELYTYDIRQTDTYALRAKRLDATTELRMNREEVVRCLELYNTRHNAHEAVKASLDRLKRPETLVIVGGQQSGLLSGQLLVIYKAITIIKAAKEAEAKLGRPVVPVFWIAGEDHDWDEVNQTYVMSGTSSPLKLALSAQPSGRSQVSEVEIASEEWAQLLRDLEQNLPDSEHKGQLLENLQGLLYASATLSEAFAKILGMLFGPYGLILLDSADPELRRLEQTMFERIIQKNEALNQAYQQAEQQVIERGYSPQADVVDGGVNLFYIHEGERLLLFRQRDRFMDRRGQVVFSQEELLQQLRLHPERFSNNVLTRPLMQDYLLPVLGTVLGNGEISYWALTRRAFEVMGMEMPPLLPRMSYTLVEPVVHKHMTRYDVTFGDVLYGLDQKKQQWLSAQDDYGMEEEFGRVRSQFRELYEPLLERATTIEKGLARVGATNQSKIEEQLSYLESKVKEALERKHETALNQWNLMGASLFPLERPQERVYNILLYMNRYGNQLLEQLMDIELDWEHLHRVVYL